MSLLAALPAAPSWRWHTTSLVGVPAPLLADARFNTRAQPLRIAGVREAHAGLFALLARCAAPAQARSVFTHFMDLAFGLLEPPVQRAGRRRWHASYRRLLQGWGADANGAAGAVLKGWVESRFGLTPLFHRAPLQRFPSPAWLTYLEQKASPQWNNNNVFQQLDLLFEFCQWMLAHFGPPAPAPDGLLTLWRGSQDLPAQRVAGDPASGRCMLRLNNIVSFSLSREQAGCFGDWVIRTRVPLCKLVVVPGLLDSHALDGEAEVLALGGDYEAEVDRGP